VGVGVFVGGFGVLVGVGDPGAVAVGVGVFVGGFDVLVGVAVGVLVAVGVGAGPEVNVSTSSGGGLPSRDSNRMPSELSGKRTKL
jgi:hypothetical protein